MPKLLFLGAGLAGLAAVPLVSLLTLMGVATTAIACPPTQSVPDAGLRADAPVPARVLPWIAVTRSACPDLPAPWIAAIMKQESDFTPDVFSDDVNGGTWGLFQINQGEWRAHYGHAWDADLDRNGVWDIKDPLTHARVAGTYLCRRLDGVRRIRAAHPDWPSVRETTELESLALAHMAGESALRNYPALGPRTREYLELLRQRVAAWTMPAQPVSTPPTPDRSPASTAPRAAAVHPPTVGSPPTAIPPVASPTAVNTPMVSVPGAGCASPPGPMARAAVAWALEHVGDAYVAGAQGPNAWDCSTFTYNAYKAAGLDWPMQISYAQYLDRVHVQLVPLEQAQPGDLLFFDTNGGQSWFNPVTHVALVLDPIEGTMVHAANPSAGVIISNYKTSRFYRAHPPVAAPGHDGRPTLGAVPVTGRILAAVPMPSLATSEGGA